MDSGILALDFATAGSFVQVFAADRADPLAKLSAERFEGKGKVDLVENHVVQIDETVFVEEGVDILFLNLLGLFGVFLVPISVFLEEDQIEPGVYRFMVGGEATGAKELQGCMDFTTDDDLVSFAVDLNMAGDGVDKGSLLNQFVGVEVEDLVDRQTLLRNIVDKDFHRFTPKYDNRYYTSSAVFVKKRGKLPF